MESLISLVANIVVIIGAVIGLIEWLHFRCRKKRESVRLISYLEKRRQEAPQEGKKGEHSLTHLVAELKIPTDRILELAFDDDRIEVKVNKDKKGLADKLLFTYRQ